MLCCPIIFFADELLLVERTLRIKEEDYKNCKVELLFLQENNKKLRESYMYNSSRANIQIYTHKRMYEHGWRERPIIRENATMA